MDREPQKWRVWDEAADEREDADLFEAFTAREAAELWGLSALVEDGDEEAVALVSLEGSDDVERFVVQVEIECRARPAGEYD